MSSSQVLTVCSCLCPQERLTLHVGSDGSVTGLDYAKLEASLPSAAALPVVAQPPASAPRILLDPYLNAATGGVSQH